MPRVLLFASLICTLGACEKPAPPSAAPPLSSPSPAATPTVAGEWAQARFDVCSVITTDEVDETQESPVTEARAMGRPDGDFLISQCLYTTEDPNRSVVLSVSERNAARRGSLSPRDSFNLTLSRYAKRQAQGEKDIIPPRKVEGLGDDAYWMGGAVYVLAKDSLLRVSVGGPSNEETKMEKAKSLAQRALPRLPQ